MKKGRESADSRPFCVWMVRRLRGSGARLKLRRAMIEHRPAEPSESDSRTKTISQIWRMMPAILALSIPLEAVTNGHGAVPVTALLAAGLSTLVVWVVGGKPVVPARVKSDDSAAQKRLQELEERLASLESITNFEHKLLDAKYSGAAPVAPATPFTFATSSGVMADSNATAAPPAPAASPMAQNG